MVELRWRAMGSDAHLVVTSASEELAEWARRRLAELERRWSRFVEDSEVCELTRRAGHPVTVSADTVLLVQRSIEAWRVTGGSFDPTVLGSVVRAGYDRSFELIGPVPTAPRSDLLVGCTDIEISGDTVTLPPGVGFDAGGIGKGLAADLVVTELLERGAEGACVNLGGDLRVAGQAPGEHGWVVAIEHPWSREPVAVVGLGSGAVATSTTLRRAWTVEDRRAHHLIDPTTGEPSATDITSASIVSGEAWMAEVLAKAVLLRGSARAFDLLDSSVADAIVVDVEGRVRATEGFARYLTAPRAERITPPGGRTESDR